MISPIFALNANTISLLFGSTTGGSGAESPAATRPSTSGEAGYTDDVFKAGNAIGKIIEIVAGMNSSVGMFTMDGAVRTDNPDGGHSLTKVGEGRFTSEAESARKDIEVAKEKALETGTDGERARAYLKAITDGTLQKIDLSTRGVTSTLTRTVMYYGDGNERGSIARFDTRGMDEFLEANTYVDEVGTLRDRESGKYAGINQNGTVFHYLVF
ncbi:MAG: hypothetical protein ACK4UW_00020 [Rhizobium rhizophilum]|uniref:hypothetical protein n=1 Tax=Rhizobium rhizophilum TaxID=1850373 RepID=UPI00391CCD83